MTEVFARITPDIMTTHASHNHSPLPEEDNASSINNFSFEDAFRGLPFVFTEPSGDYQSGFEHGTEGSQYLANQAIQPDTLIQGFSTGTRTQSYQEGANPFSFPQSSLDHWGSLSGPAQGGDLLRRWISQTSGPSSVTGMAATSHQNDLQQFTDAQVHVTASVYSGHSDISDSASLADTSYYTSGQIFMSTGYGELPVQTSQDGSLAQNLYPGSNEVSGQPVASGAFCNFSNPSGLDMGFSLDSPQPALTLVTLNSRTEKDSEYQNLTWTASHGSPESFYSPTIYGGTNPAPTVAPYMQQSVSQRSYVTNKTRSTGSPTLQDHFPITSSQWESHSNSVAGIYQEATYFPTPTSQVVSPRSISQDIFSALETSRRSTPEGDNSARDHPLYQNPTVGADGLYHCPWEGIDASCTHKPEKLKCNYDKFVDSHRKPYRCKVASCEASRFSSTACLLRHEREAHAMHGHGAKPFLCRAPGCDRGVPGQGFPRHWNLRDHMKRVHNDADVPDITPARKRKRATAAAAGTATAAANVVVPRKRAREVNKEEEEFRRRKTELLESMQGISADDPSAVAKLRAVQKLVEDMTRSSELVGGKAANREVG